MTITKKVKNKTSKVHWDTIYKLLPEVDYGMSAKIHCTTVDGFNYIISVTNRRRMK